MRTGTSETGGGEEKRGMHLLANFLSGAQREKKDGSSGSGSQINERQERGS